MTEFKKGDGKTKQSWRNIGVGAGSSGWICCPVCAGRISLVGTEVSKDGIVEMLSCMYFVPSHWSDEVKLIGWEAGQQMPTPTKPRAPDGREADLI